MAHSKAHMVHAFSPAKKRNYFLQHKSKILLAVNLYDIVGSIAPTFFLTSCCFCAAETVGCSENIPGQVKDQPCCSHKEFAQKEYSIDYDTIH